ncbi:MAG: DEAD/DEAH box helicase [Anaerolineales bacterium]|nr:DEAD/DEAH box helicase [Anaerolineales bacterium]
MSVDEILNGLRRNHDFMRQVSAWQQLPARTARYAPISGELMPALTHALHLRGLDEFYTHQARAIDAALSGENVVIATATASGKSLCYTVPVLQRLLTQPHGCALYLFPTKALAHDQFADTAQLIQTGQLPVTVHPYDGDTPQNQRRQVRQQGSIVITNPDMLHAGILPFHPTWRTLLSNLQFIVIDEIHAYRGVFGSHVANVLRRLRRLCQFYGSQPQFICCSATIANPREHARRLVELPFHLVDERDNGAPSARKHFILYNPPVVDESLGLRQSMILAARDAATLFLRHNVQTVVFARARQTVELLLTYLQDDARAAGQDPRQIRGYRGGYLPLERREIESGLRQGQVMGVVATNALELGVDIGALAAAVLAGYPGSIAAAWQQAGRAGRRVGEADEAAAAVLLVAGSGALDQYICKHPRYLFGRSPENALINPDNARLLVNHLLCAAYELPFVAGESFGAFGVVDDLLRTLVDAGMMHQTRRQTHYLGEGVPAHQFSLRTSSQETVVVQDISGPRPVVIGELDLETAPVVVYEGAIYMHQARTYLVERFDWEGRLAQVRPLDVDYYTRASATTQITRLAPEVETTDAGILHAYGEATVVTQATGYRLVKRYTHETLGYGPIDLPQTTLETTAYWMVLGPEVTDTLIAEGVLLAPNDYGPDWARQRRLVLDRDGHQCRNCGASAAPGQGLHVHHVRPFREFVWDWPPDLPPDDAFYARANHPDNLVTLCPACHRRAEEGQQTRSALGGLAYALRNLAPLFLMCDPGDIEVSVEARSPLTLFPTVVIYERVPAGIGFSQRLFQRRRDLLAAALELVNDCACRDGCPACVGPPGDIGPDTKTVTRRLLRRLQA